MSTCPNCGARTERVVHDGHTYDACTECDRWTKVERLCECGCGQSITHRSLRAHYVDHNHAQRAYRERVKGAMVAAGLPPSPSLSAVPSHTPTSKHHGDAESGRNRPDTDSEGGRKQVNAPGMGVRCYFTSTVQADEVTAALVAAGLNDAAARVARASGRQRARLQMSLDLADAA